MTRLEANRRLLKILSDIIEAEPSSRFGQILRNHNFIKEDYLTGEWQEEFYLESESLLKRVEDE